MDFFSLSAPNSAIVVALLHASWQQTPGEASRIWNKNSEQEICPPIRSSIYVCETTVYLSYLYKLCTAYVDIKTAIIRVHQHWNTHALPLMVTNTYLQHKTWQLNDSRYLYRSIPYSILRFLCMQSLSQTVLLFMFTFNTPRSFQHISHPQTTKLQNSSRKSTGGRGSQGIYSQNMLKELLEKSTSQSKNSQGPQVLSTIMFEQTENPFLSKWHYQTTERHQTSKLGKKRSAFHKKNQEKKRIQVIQAVTKLYTPKI